VNQASAYTAGGVVPGRMGNEHPSIAPYELLRARGGPLVVAVGNERQFAALCSVLGLDELPRDERFATNERRVAHRAELRARLEERLAEDEPAAWAELLLGAGVPAGVVNTVAEAVAYAERLGLEPVVELGRTDGPPVRLVRNPVRLSETPAGYRLPPPRLPR
jgi:crotonobetainyl-CoA:carnitine CoA-transferase CaiB-like acyl-CoA transferase